MTTFMAAFILQRETLRFHVEFGTVADKVFSYDPGGRNRGRSRLMAMKPQVGGEHVAI
jgi:hypothetical protein